MNWVDLSIVLLLLLYAVIGWRRGFLLGGIEVLGFLLSILVAVIMYQRLAPVLENVFGISRNFAKAGAFLVIWIAISSLSRMIMRRVYRRIPQSVRLSRANRVLGVIPAMVRGLIIVALIAMLLVVAPGFEGVSAAILDSRIGRPLVEQASVAEQQAQEIFGGAIRDTLSFLTIEPEPTSPERIDLRYRIEDVEVDARAEEEMLRLLNRERTARGIRPLAPDPELRLVARSHSQDMFARGYFSHVTPDGLSPFDRMRRQEVSFITAGENLALAPTVEIAHNGLMRSPGHRENILDPAFGRAGIGIVRSRFHGRMFTQNFRN